MSNQEAWNKFMQTGRVDYYLLSRGVNIYASGVFPQEDKIKSVTAQSFGGDAVESYGFGNDIESASVGRQ